MDADRNLGGKEATQARIVGAAARLFVQHGYHRATIAKIAARAGVSRAAVFWHFGDKASLFREVCRHFIRPFVEQLESSVHDLEPRKRIFETFAIYEQFVMEHRETIESFVRWVLESPEDAAEFQKSLMALHDRFTDELREAVAALVLDRGEADAIATGLVSLMDGNLLLALFAPDRGAQERRAAGLRALAEAALPRS